MFKKVVLIIILSLCIGGCKKNSNKFYLDDEFYSTGEYIEIKSEEFNNLNNQNYVLFTYNNYCNLAIPCDKVFLEFMQKNKINFLSMPFAEFKNTKLYETIKYAPSVIIVKDGKILDYLEANSDDDLEKYQDVDKFEDWINDYIYLTK